MTDQQPPPAALRTIRVPAPVGHEATLAADALSCEARPMLSAADFDWDDSWWVTDLDLPEWAGYGGASGPFEVTFAHADDEHRPLGPDELALVQWLADHHADVFTAVTDALVAGYAARHAALAAISPEEAGELPDVVHDAADLRPLVQLTSITVHPIHTGGAPYLGVQLWAAWDREHGAGVLTRGATLIESGGADTAILLWIAQRHAAL